MTKMRFLLAAVAMTSVACTTPQPQPAPAPDVAPLATPTLADVEAEITRTYFTELPEWATYYAAGEELAGAGFDGRLTGRAPASEVARRTAFRALLAQLDAVDPASASNRDQTVHALLKTQLQSALAPANVVDYGAILSDWGMWFVPYPVSHLSGPQDAVPKLLEGNIPSRIPPMPRTTWRACRPIRRQSMKPSRPSSTIASSAWCRPTSCSTRRW